MLTHPQFDPVFFSLGPLAVRWYGLTYVFAFMAFIALGKWRARREPWRGFTELDVDDMVLYGVAGVILGGRFGYALFYDFARFIEHPAMLFGFVNGQFVGLAGMSFHGGFLGVVAALSLYCWRRNHNWLALMDFISPLCPLGFMFVRIGNFINGELPGRITTLPWGMWFPQVDAQPLARHPSQLYQAAGEGLALFLLLWWFSAKPRGRGALGGAFLLGYGSFRFLAEFAREPDAHLGFLTLGFSMGQWLSLPMMLGGLGVLLWASGRPPHGVPGQVVS